MDNAKNSRQLVQLVSNSLRRSQLEKDVVAQLVASGIPMDQAPKLYSAIKHAIQAGVQSEFTGGLSAEGGPPTDPLLAEAFREGKASFRAAVRQSWLERLAVPFVLVTVVIGIFVVWWWVAW